MYIGFSILIGTITFIITLVIQVDNYEDKINTGDSLWFLIVALVAGIFWPISLTLYFIYFAILKPLTKYFNQIQDRKREQLNEQRKLY